MDAASKGHEPDVFAHRGAELVESLVEVVRDKAVRPIVRGARYLVLGVIGVTIALVVGTLAVVGLVRLLDRDAFGGRAFITDLIFGGIFLLAGTFLIARGLRARLPRTESERDNG